MLDLTSDPSDAQLRHLALNMRDCDRREVYASSGEDAYQSLFQSVEASHVSYMILLEDEPVAVTGVAEVLDSVGAPWLLCADNITKLPRRTFWRASKAFVAEFHEYYPTLTNYVDERNTVSKGWLAKLGFEFMETVPYGHLKLPFTRFEKVQCVNRLPSLPSPA